MMSLRNFLVFGVGRLIPDKMWIQIKYFQFFRRFVDFKDPQTYNEKLQWLKLYDRRPEYVTMVDKYKVKKYVAGKIGKEYVVPLLGGPWRSFDEIDFDKLPGQFVLKTNHDCGGVVVCKDQGSFDRAAARKFLQEHLSRNYYYAYREWPYKNVRPRIFAEKYMKDAEGKDDQLTDYKFFCFGGVPKVVLIATDRADEDKETKTDFFDMDFRHLPITSGHPNADMPPAKPASFDQMRDLAAKLAEGIPHVRVDFYESEGKIYFGELTLSHWSGLVPLQPKEWDERFGEWIELPERGGNI